MSARRRRVSAVVLALALAGAQWLLGAGARDGRACGGSACLVPALAQ
jgi:hypothetical protein